MSDKPPQFPKEIMCKVCRKSPAMIYLIDWYTPPQSDGEKHYRAYYRCLRCEGLRRIGESEARRVN